MSRLRLLRPMLLILAILGGCDPSGTTSKPTYKSSESKKDTRTSTKTESDTPLSALLATLPKELWPKDGRDSQRILKSNDWFAKNLAGRRARYTLGPAWEKSINASNNGSYDFYIRGPRTENLFGGEWTVLLEAPSVSIVVRGASEQAAERLHAQAEPPEVTFKIKYVKLGSDYVNLGWENRIFVAYEEDIRITGIHP